MREQYTHYAHHKTKHDAMPVNSGIVDKAGRHTTTAGGWTFVNEVGGSKTTAAHRTTVQAAGVALAFGGYDDSEDSDTRKSLGEFVLSVGATAAAEKFTASHQLQAPSFRIGTNDSNYVLLTYDDTNDQFVVTRVKDGVENVSNPITF